MPHDITMPQLGMAQDAGKIVSWLKNPGDPVSKGDALFEVETDKAVMEVESPANGFLTGVAYAEGDDVPVGHVIARISDSAEENSAPAAAQPAAETEGALPEGHSVTMPQLGMAQDTGLLVAWLKAPGEEVATDDILFEVETDKSTMEVAAGRNGWLAATLAAAGEEVPVGAPVAILTDGKPETTLARTTNDAPPVATAPATPPATKSATKSPTSPEAEPKPAPQKAQAGGGRILASPKARRLALEQGLDLARLAEAGHPQPFHVADLAALKTLPANAPALTTTEAPRRLTATCAQDGFVEFAGWAAKAQDLRDGDALLAGLAAASLGTEGNVTIAVERFGAARRFTVPHGRALSNVDEGGDTTPDLILRDLRATRVSTVSMGAEAAPVLTVARDGAGLSITLECAATQLDASRAIRLLTEFAGRMEQPLRHLL